MIETTLQRKHIAFLIASTVLPPIGLLAAIALLWQTGAVGWLNMGLLVGFYCVGAIGISLGYHRLFTHGSFKTGRAVRMLLAVCGTFAGHGPVIIWAAHHRRHHAFTDRVGDPHSPHVAPPADRLRVLRSLWFAHSGWRFSENIAANPARYVRDLLRDSDLRWISRHYIPITAAGMALPGVIGFAVTGSITGAVTGFVWGGLVPMFLGHHATYSVNSLGHYVGARRFATGDESRNVAWLALPTLGDSWHNNHHAFPRTARHGFRRWELDISGMIVGALQRLRLAWDVVPPPTAAEERELTPTPRNESSPALVGGAHGSPS